MINGRVEKALNAQFAEELRSAYAYLAMSAYCEEQKLPGMAHWLRAQFEEETGHAMKFYGFITDRGGRVRFEALERPTEDFKSALNVFETALDQEKRVTESINTLYSVTAEERDYASQAFLDWFVTEQVEEEKTVTDVVDSLQRVGDKGEGLFLLDKELGGRGAE